MAAVSVSSAFLRCRSSFLFRGPLLPAFASPKLPFSTIRSANHGRCTRRRVAAGGVSCRQVKIEDGTDEEACELVNGAEISIGEGSDTIRAYLLTAVKNNNGTGILLLSDIFGFEDSATRDFAYRVACNGYNVLLPDLFNGDQWAKERPQDLFQPWLLNHKHKVSNVISMSVKWMVDEFLAAGISKKLGIIGFCFGGGRVIDALAEDQGSHFGVGVSFYGMMMDGSVAAQVKVPVLFIAGDDDPFCPVTVLKDMHKNISQGSRVEIFKGRGHGFAHRPQTPADDKDAEQAFMFMRNWLHNGLVLET